MGKYGKAMSISMNPLDYNITILGESGIGKTTLAKELCEKLGVDYIHFNMGREAGADAIEGIISEDIPDYEKAKDVVDDIVENKTTDYPDLKVVIWDTLDECVPIFESETIRQHNKKNPDKRIETINSAMGGFGKGQDYAINLMLDLMDKLKSVGVRSLVIGHVKRTEITDPITQETFSKLTADTTQKYFNAIKNKQHFVALAYIDREIVKEKTGKKNIVTKQDITINKAVSESRVISFRDDTYSVDSKSRFANITDKVPFNVDAFIKAMKDAIVSEKTKNGKTVEEANKEQKVRDDNNAAKEKEASKSAKQNKVDEKRNAEILVILKEKLPSASAEIKETAKGMIVEAGFEKFTDDNIPTAIMEKVLELLAE